jgi:hypothetical protein
MRLEVLPAARVTSAPRERSYDIPAWYERLLERRGYKQSLEDWFNPSYMSLMKEKGAEAQSRVKAITASA